MHEYAISDGEFRLFQELVHDLIGIQLNDNKKVLVLSRLSSRLRRLGLANFSEYHRYLVEEGAAKGELVQLINQITTNKTDFFREPHHFDYLQEQFLPAFVASRERKLRIWSAGCSSGEEPYTIAMVLLDFFQARRINVAALDVKVLATDIDTEVLARAQAGEYRLAALGDIPERYRRRFTESIDGQRFAMAAEPRNLISFRRFNLMHPFPFKHGFDIIFCRNVLIYFNNDDRMAIIGKFRGSTRPGGVLVLGHSETLLTDQCGYRGIGNTVYAKA